VSFTFIYWSKYLWICWDCADLFMGETDGNDFLIWYYKLSNSVNTGLEIKGAETVLSFDNFLTGWGGCYCLVLVYADFLDYFLANGWILV